MLLTNQHLDKLAASCVDFTACGMLDGPLLTSGIANNLHVGTASNSVNDASGNGDVKAAARITSMRDVKLAQNPGK